MSAPLLPRTVVLLSDHPADQSVWAQALDRHPDKITLITDPDDAAIKSAGAVLVRAPHTPPANTRARIFDLGEERIRIGALIDRIEAALLQADIPETLTYGAFTLRFHETHLHHRGRAIALTDRERDILHCLILAGDEGCTRDTLLESVWAYRADLDTHTLETHIYRLRRKIEDDPTNPVYLVTVAGGYGLAGNGDTGGIIT